MGAIHARLERAKAAFFLREVGRLGEGVELEGRPLLVGSRSIAIGARCRISSRPVQSHLVAAAEATLELGEGVSIAYGAAISAMREVRIGDGTQIGPFVVIMDSDFHVAGDRHAHGAPSPIHIGKAVVIEARVTILRGSTIGDGARVKSGSVVSGSVPACAVVAGVPARSELFDLAGADELADLPSLVKRILNLAELPAPSDGPAQIPAWDSLGSLKLLLALEQRFGVTIAEHQLKAAQSVARLGEIVERARAAG